MKRSKAPSALAAKKAQPSSSSISSGFKSPLAATTKPKEKEEEETHLDEELVSQDTPKQNNTIQNEVPKSTTTFRAPFKSPTSTAIAKPAAKSATKEEPKESIVYSVMWCNYTTKKHKSYNDGNH